MTEIASDTQQPAERPTAQSGVVVTTTDVNKPVAGLGVGAHEGADRTSRELATWAPIIRSPDREINGEKRVLDARGRDLVRNTGMMQGAVHVHRNSIVGGHFRLNSRPNYEYLGLDEKWAEEFQKEVEAKFTLYAESNDCWIDAARMNTLTGLIRLGIGQFFFGGEVLGTMEWIRERFRPYFTAMQMVDPDRLSNPNGIADTEFLRAGVEKNMRGAPQAYHIRRAHPADIATSPQRAMEWVRVPIRKPWGRLMVMHIIEQMRPDQTRGVAEMVTILKEMRMTKKFHDIVLQNAVVNATFAAAIESELPPEVALQTVGVKTADGGQIDMSYADALLASVAEYTSGGKNLHIDGVKIPHLYPNTKLKLYPAGEPGGVGDNFEQSLHRYVARGLGISYEEFTGDYSQTNYSSARASMNNTWKYMQARKKSVADRQANTAYVCWLEEAINSGDITSMPRNAPSFYERMNKDAYAQATWIGASRGQVDEVKETQAAAARINAGLSTLEDECAALGKDFREVIAQRAREIKMLEQAGVSIDLQGNVSNTNSDKPDDDEDESNGDKNKDTNNVDA